MAGRRDPDESDDQGSRLVGQDGPSTPQLETATDQLSLKGSSRAFPLSGLFRTWWTGTDA